MPDVLDQLRREHHDLEKLIGVLERQLVTIENGKIFDFNILQSVFKYLGNYPDLLHHPREDLVYDRLKQRDPALAGGISDIVAEHFELESMTRRIAGLVEARLHFAPAPDEGLVERGREFVDFYRRHIAVEENELFPRALVVLDDADWAGIAVAVSPETDPLFDGTVAAQYQALHREIMRLGA